MVPNAAPAAHAAQWWLAAMAADVVRAAQLHGPGRWATALSVVVAAYLVGRVGSELLAGLLRLALIVAAVFFGYEILRVAG